MPRVALDVSLATRYNALTGASLSHFDIARMGVFERDEVEALVDYLESK